MKALFNITYTTKTPKIGATAAERAEHIQSRQYYDMTAKYNYFTYTLNGKKTQKNKDIHQYMTKCGTPLFNMDKVYSKEELNQLKKRLKNSESIIWHGFISFDQETSKGFNDTESAQHFLKSTMTVLFERAGLNPKNIELYASIHFDTPHHRHIHFAFFEKEPKRRSSNGKLCYTQRGKLPKAALENYLVSANMHLDNKQYDYYSARDRAMDKLKETRGKQIIEYGDKTIKTAFDNLCRVLPKSGRMQYNSSNLTPYRKQIDAVAILLLKTNPTAMQEHLQMMRELAYKQTEVGKICQEGKIGYSERNMTEKQTADILSGNGKVHLPSEGNIDYIQRLMLDYKGRLGNRVLALVKEMRKDRIVKMRARVNDKACKIAAKRRQIMNSQLIKKAIKNIGCFAGKARADFTADLRKAEQEIEQNMA